MDTITFVGAGIIGGSLADGQYTLTIRGSRIHDDFGQALDGAGTGLEGSNSTDTFFRLFGDADGDGHVDWQDLLSFFSTLGKRAGDPARRSVHRALTQPGSPKEMLHNHARSFRLPQLG